MNEVLTAVQAVVLLIGLTCMAISVYFLNEANRNIREARRLNANARALLAQAEADLGEAGAIAEQWK